MWHLYTKHQPLVPYSISVVITFAIVCVTGRVLAFPSLNPTQERMDNPDERGPFFQGDIVLPPGSDARGGIIGELLRWPNATVVYAIDIDFTENERSLVLAAMEEIASLTCVSFRNRATEVGYVFIQRGGPNSGGCWSLLGRLGIAQLLNLQADGGCITKGIIMHELLHTIGFYHEQSRTDRDDYITINWDNIKLGEDSQFAKLPSLLYNITYDYGSIMHYGRYAFAKDPSIPTIETLEPDVVIGQRKALSQADIDAVNTMYCPEDEY